MLNLSTDSRRLRPAEGRIEIVIFINILFYCHLWNAQFFIFLNHKCHPELVEGWEAH